MPPFTILFLIIFCVIVLGLTSVFGVLTYTRVNTVFDKLKEHQEEIDRRQLKALAALVVLNKHKDQPPD